MMPPFWKFSLYILYMMRRSAVRDGSRRGKLPVDFSSREAYTVDNFGKGEIFMERHLLTANAYAVFTAAYYYGWGFLAYARGRENLSLR